MDAMEALFEELVPPAGKADTKAGEIVRAFCRLNYRNYNDGDHIGIGYGKETCNAAARYLAKSCEGADDIIFDRLWGVYSDDLYDKGLEVLESHIVDYIESHPELKAEENTEDMLDYFDEFEDRDDEEEEW